MFCNCVWGEVGSWARPAQIDVTAGAATDGCVPGYWGEYWRFSGEYSYEHQSSSSLDLDTVYSSMAQSIAVGSAFDFLISVG